MYQPVKGASHPVAWAVVATFLLAALIPGEVAEVRAATCLPGMCPFSENGKKGRFLDTRIEPEALAKADATLASSVSSEGLLAAESVNRGELFGTGLSMPATERRLVELIDTFRPYWKYRDVPRVRVRIVGTTSFVPQAFADNVILVPLGLLMRAKTDGQVAWLLAHEFSHIAMAHFAREARAKKRKKSIAEIVGAVDLLTEASQMRVDNAGGKMRLYEVTDKDAVALGNSIWAHSRRLEDALLITGAYFSRQDEDRADVSGIDLAGAAGYPRSDALDALAIIAQEEKDAASLFDTVGQQVKDYGSRSGLAAIGSIKDASNIGAVATGWLKDLGNNAMTVAMTETKKAYLVQHRPTDKRIEGIRRYIERAYKDVADRPPSLALLKAVRATPEYIEASRAVDARAHAMKSIEDNKPAQARADLQPALSTRYGGTPLIANTQAKILEIQGDLAGADMAYTRAEKLQNVVVTPIRAPAPRARRRGTPVPAPAAPTPPFVPQLQDPFLEQTLGGFGDHVSLLVRMAAYPKALAVIQEAKRRFGDDKAFLPQYIAIYTNTHQTALLVAAINRCIDAADPSIDQQCRSAMLSDAQQKKMEAMSPADQEKVETALARTSSKAKSGGVMEQIRNALKPSDDDESGN